MNTTFRVLLFLAAVVFSFAPAEAQTQAEMNNQASAEFTRIDRELNKLYPQLLAKLDAEGQEKLKVSQHAWVAFRDAQAEVDADTSRGGTMAPLLRATSRTQTTRDRIEQLRGLLKEIGR